MFSTRTVAVIGVLAMATITLTSTPAHAQSKHHTKTQDPDTDPDTDNAGDTESETPKPKAKAKSRAKTKAKGKARTKDKTKEVEADADTDAERDKEREKDKEREREDQERAQERERERAETAKALDKAKETATDAATQTGGGGEAYHSGTLGFSIPISTIGAVAGVGAGGEAVPTVDVVYFLDDKAALDLIVGLNVHRKQTAGVAGAAGSDTNLIGVTAGLGYRMYSVKNALRSFLEPQVVVSLPDISATDSLGVNVGAAMGLERSLTPWFSISGALGVALNFTNSFKDIQLATTANLAANLYWH